MHRDQDFRRVGDLAQAGAGHLEDGQFVRAAEPVLDAAQDAVGTLGVAFELQDHVHDMFEHLGTGDRAVLGDMADQDDRGCALLGITEQSRGALTHLRDAARCGIDRFAVDGLDGVHDQQMRLHLAGAVQDVFEQGFTQDQAIAVVAAKPLRAQLDLFGTLLAADIQRFEACAAERNLERQGGLADSRLAADQHHRTLHQAAAQHAVQFAAAQRKAVVVCKINLAERLGTRLLNGQDGPVAAGDRAAAGARGLGSLGLFHHRIPFAARGAAAHPFGAFIATGSAIPDGFRFRCHSLMLLYFRESVP